MTDTLIQRIEAAKEPRPCIKGKPHSWTQIRTVLDTAGALWRCRDCGQLSVAVSTTLAKLENSRDMD